MNPYEPPLSSPKDPAGEEPTASSLGDYVPPRFSIAMLFVWAAFIALQMVYWNDMLARLREIHLGALSCLVLLAALISAGLTAIALSVWWRSHGIRFPVQPGEWLLVAYGACFLLVFIFQRVLERFSAGGANDLGWVPVLSEQLIDIAPFIVTWRYGKGGVNWFGAFAVIVGYRLLPIGGLVSNLALGFDNPVNAALFFLNASSAYVICAVVLGSVAIDYRRGMPRGWIHYVGVVVIVGDQIQQVVSRRLMEQLQGA